MFDISLGRLPSSRIRSAAGWIRYATRVLVAMRRGMFVRRCPICHYEGRFRAAGLPPRFDASCRGCGSLERHRLYYLAANAGAFDLHGKSVLHFAPEPGLGKLVRTSAASRYTTADLFHKADLMLDMAEIGLMDESYDVVICNHVFEHVPDDRKAAREIHRILRSDGCLLATVPLVEAWSSTYESAEVATATQRLLHYNQEDHVRYYGRNFRRVLQDAGFALKEYVASGEDAATYALIRGETIFIGWKRAAD